MDSEYIALIQLVEEYKAHCHSADDEIMKLRSHIEKKNDLLQSNEQKLSLWHEMEESVIHMDQEITSIKKELTNRNIQIENLKEDLYRANQLEKSMTGSINAQHSATKDDLKQVRAKNDILQTYNDELEEQLSLQESDMVEMRIYMKELEKACKRSPKQFGNTINHNTNSNEVWIGKSTTNKQILSKPETVSDIDIDIGIDIDSDEISSNQSSTIYESPITPATQALAAAAATAARQRDPEQVKNISNRGDGSYGFPSPRSRKNSQPNHNLDSESKNSENKYSKEKMKRTLAIKVLPTPLQESNDSVSAFDFDVKNTSETDRLPKPPRISVKSVDNITKDDSVFAEIKIKARKEREDQGKGFVKPKTMRA
jgi:hypothetical protein